MKKRFTKILLGGLMAGSFLTLASCDEASLNLEKIVIWGPNEEEQVVKYILNKYNENQNILGNKIEFEFKSVGEGEIGKKLDLNTAKSDSLRPSLFLCADDQISSLKELNILEKLDNDNKKFVMTSNTTASAKAVLIGSDTFGFPISNDNGYFLWYNSNFLKEDDVKSLERILEIANQKGKKFYMNLDNGWYANSFIMSYQAEGESSISWSSVTDSTGNDHYIKYSSTWDGEKGVQVSEYIANLVSPYYQNGTWFDGTKEANDIKENQKENTSADQLFQNKVKSGEIIAGVSGTWEEGWISGISGWTATKLPAYHIGDQEYQMASFSGAKAYCVNAFSTVGQKNAAMLAAKLLSEEEAQIYRFQKRTTIPCNKDAMDSFEYKSNASIGSKALTLQNRVGGCSQFLCAEERYWEIGADIGRAYLNNNPTNAEGASASWKDFLTYKMDILRNEPVDNGDGDGNSSPTDFDYNNPFNALIVYYYDPNYSFKNNVYEDCVFMFGEGSPKEYKYYKVEDGMAKIIIPLSEFNGKTTLNVSIFGASGNLDACSNMSIKLDNWSSNDRNNYIYYLVSGIEGQFNTKQN